MTRQSHDFFLLFPNIFLNAVPAQIKIGGFEVDAVAGISETVFAHNLDAVALSEFELEGEHIEKGIKVLADGGRGIGKLIGERALLQPRLRILHSTLFTTDILIDIKQLVFVGLHLHLRQAGGHIPVFLCPFNLS